MTGQACEKAWTDALAVSPGKDGEGQRSPFAAWAQVE